MTNRQAILKEMAAVGAAEREAIFGVENHIKMVVNRAGGRVGVFGLLLAYSLIEDAVDLAATRPAGRVENITPPSAREAPKPSLDW